MSDHALLRDYATNGSEAAFRELVERPQLLRLRRNARSEPRRVYLSRLPRLPQ